MKKIGVILSGCGYLDGAEITEAVSTLLSLSQRGALAVCFAPDKEQHHVVNHISQEEMPGKRNVLVEAARIARGKVQPVSEAKATELDAIILPGGFGAAKNLCDYTLKGPDCEVDADVLSLIKQMHAAGKPIGAICIAPALIAKVFEGSGVQVTIGNDADTVAALSKLGASHLECSVETACLDEKNKIVTVPAYMYDAEPKDVFQGIDELVKKVLKLA